MASLFGDIKGPKFLDGRTVSARPSSVELSVLFPCFNEADRIETVIEEWSRFLDDEIPSHEIVILNDGSTDGTGRILDKLRKERPHLRVIHQLNSGPNRCAQRGLELARGTFVLFAESNQSFEPEDFRSMWEKKNHYAMVSAFRTHRLDPVSRRMLSGVLRQVLHWGFGISLKDPGSPYRLVRREVAFPLGEELKNESESFLLCLGALMKVRRPESILEVPVPFRKRPPGAARRKPRSGLTRLAYRTICDLLQLRVTLATPAARASQVTP